MKTERNIAPPISKKFIKASNRVLLGVVAANVTYHRERAKLSKRQLAIGARLSPSYITMIEQAGREAALSKLARIATVLGVKLSALVE